MKTFNFFSRSVASTVACLTILTLLSGCDSKKKDTPKPITVADAKQLEQTVFADKTSGASAVGVTTTGAWTSTIVEKTQTKAAATAPDWISISPDHGDKAGVYNIAITLTPNYTGADRTAIVTVSCSGTEVAVTLTQKATKEDGTENEWFNRTITGHIVNGDNVTDLKLMVEPGGDIDITELASATCQNGDFTITLPKTVENRLLYLAYDNKTPNTMQLADKGLRMTDPWFTSADGTIVPCSADGKVMAHLLYSDRNTTLTGYMTDDGNRIEYDWNLKAGWNWMYTVVKNTTTVVYTSSKPDVELRWELNPSDTSK